MQACDSFKEITLNNCPDNFIIDAGLTPSSTYSWALQNKFNRIFFGESTSDEDGILTIPVEDPLSKDMFHDFSNAYELRLFLVNEDESKTPVVFCSQYNYLVLIFQDVQPLPDTNDVTITIECS